MEAMHAMSKYDAAVFDMDGLLVDSESVWAKALRTTFAEYGFEMSYETSISFVGTATYEEERCIREMYHDDPRAMEAFRAHEKLAISMLRNEGLPVKEGARELLEELSKLGIPCAVASGSPRGLVEAELGNAGLLEFFRFIVTSEGGIPSKPAPDIFLVASERLGTDPVRTVVFEDSPAGVEAAVAAGMPVIVVPDLVAPTAEQEALCVARCDTLREAIAYL